jgi:hypothetical protein
VSRVNGLRGALVYEHCYGLPDGLPLGHEIALCVQVLVPVVPMRLGDREAGQESGGCGYRNGFHGDERLIAKSYASIFSFSPWEFSKNCRTERLFVCSLRSCFVAGPARKGILFVLFELKKGTQRCLLVLPNVFVSFFVLAQGKTVKDSIVRILSTE